MTTPAKSQPTQRTDKHSLFTRIFHWVGALLIIVAFISINMGDEYISLHKSIGASFFIWTLLRIINRFITKTPPHPPMPKWQMTLAHLTHLGLYVAMLAMPITGMLMSMYGGRGVSVFGLFSLPSVVGIDRQMAKVMNGLHTGAVFYVLVFLVIAHVGGALYHQFVMKDNLISRMK
ncbi:Cytochrome b561 homolog 1 [Moraxella lacunata]|uniref:Cytochrome b561 homolog 1 n=1 Tax=Moraxella lacunata TaxID=477 RepID=A0A378QKR2_MORLA|nr:cytochrome b [Moraxella lacunata]STZ01368.1 Cytochrome b561 homolog 1 [Moraxella lacunata]